MSNIYRTLNILWGRCGVMLLAATLAACSTPRARAPVEERPVSGSARPASAPRVAVPAPPAATPVEVRPAPVAAPAPAVVADDAGKPGFYSVKPGDILIRIGLDHGQNWRDIARWSGLANPNLIEVGQVLRVAPPVLEAQAASPRAVAPGLVETRPLDARPTNPASAAVTPVAPVAVAATAASAPAVAAQAAAAASGVMAAGAPATAASAVAAAPRESDEDLPWLWPSSGPLLAGFEEGKNKGLAIGGKAGDAVLAAADGRVVYAGSGLRGYGNLVIVKHNANFLSAYAHNQTLLVKEDQVVRRGQRIADMGASDAERVQLHFEIRRLGKPVDPARLLPAR